MSELPGDRYARLAAQRRAHAETIADPKWRAVWLASANYFDGRATEENAPVLLTIEERIDDSDDA